MVNSKLNSCEQNEVPFSFVTKQKENGISVSQGKKKLEVKRQAFLQNIYIHVNQDILMSTAVSKIYSSFQNSLSRSCSKIERALGQWTQGSYQLFDDFPLIFFTGTTRYKIKH